jgi:DNA repair exonuclease SbcCD ATPase subunit
MMNTQQYRNRLEQLKGKRQQVESNIKTLKKEIRTTQIDLRQHEQALIIVRQVGLKTQQQLQFHISDITSLAIESVFSDPYELKVEFVECRNKVECDLYFERKGQRVDPLTAAGVGSVDVAAFALRIASWSMQTPKLRNLIILDEPLRFLSMEYQELASQMIKEISQRLKIQFIIVTHNRTLTSYADKIFEVSIRKGISKVEVI